MRYGFNNVSTTTVADDNTFRIQCHLPKMAGRTIEELVLAPDGILFPNPTKARFSIAVQHTNLDYVDLEILDTQGRRVYE